MTLSFKENPIKKEGKPGLFARVYEEKTWIQEKMSHWSGWTSCDHTCLQKRARACTAIDTGCNNGLIVETQKCPDDQMKTKYEDVALPWLAAGYQETDISDKLTRKWVTFM